MGLSLKQRASALKSETLALYFAARHPGTPWYAKLFLIAIVGYAFSPIDLIPDFIPVLGYLDEWILLPAGIALAIRMIPPGVLADCRERARSAPSSVDRTSRIAAMVIVLVWLALSALCIVWSYKLLANAAPSAN